MPTDGTLKVLSSYETRNTYDMKQLAYGIVMQYYSSQRRINKFQSLIISWRVGAFKHVLFMHIFFKAKESRSHSMDQYNLHQ